MSPTQSPNRQKARFPSQTFVNIVFCFKNRSRKGLQKSLKKPPPRLLQRSSFNGPFKNRSRIVQEPIRHVTRILLQECFKKRPSNIAQESLKNCEKSFNNHSRTFEECDKKPAARILQGSSLNESSMKTED